jgi:hypothetical protein
MNYESCPLCFDFVNFRACGDKECPRRLTQPTETDMARAEAWGLSMHLTTFGHLSGTVLPNQLRSAILAVADDLDNFANDRPRHDAPFDHAVRDARGG